MAAPVAILGYPGNGPFTAVPGRIGRTTAVIWNDATALHRVFRTVTTFAGVVRPGNSGSPAVDARGAVETTVFAARTTTGRGYGVPADPVRRALAGARNAPVSTGDCAE